MSPEVRADLGAPDAARLAPEGIPFQCRRSCPVHTPLVESVESDVHCHAEREGEKPRTPKPHQEHHQRNEWAVEPVCGRVLRSLRLVEEAHRRRGVEAPFSQTEPDVVITVDEDPAGPQAQSVTAKPRCEDRRTRRGEHDVISNAHHTLEARRLPAPVSLGRCPCLRYQSRLRAAPVGNVVVAVKSSTRCARVTS